MKVWGLFINFLSLVSSFFYAYYAAYRHGDTKSQRLMFFIEILFLLDFFLSFSKTMPDPRSSAFPPITDYEQILNHYIKTNMLEHLIPLVPLQIIPMERSRQKVLYIVKLIRINRGLKNLKIMNLMKYVKQAHQERLENIIK